MAAIHGYWLGRFVESSRIRTSEPLARSGRKLRLAPKGTRATREIRVRDLKFRKAATLLRATGKNESQIARLLAKSDINKEWGLSVERIRKIIRTK